MSPREKILLEALHACRAHFDYLCTRPKDNPLITARAGYEVAVKALDEYWELEEVKPEYQSN